MAKRGFTLIELLVVIAIIGLLSSVVLASLNSARQKGRDSKKLQDLAQLRNALELYFAQNKVYPITHETAYTYTNVLGNCTLSGSYSINGYVQTSDWIPGLVASKFIAKLPEADGSYTGTNGSQSCYVYMSNGNDYKLSNLRGFEQLCPPGDTKAVCVNPIASDAVYTGTIHTPAAKDWAISATLGFN